MSSSDLKKDNLKNVSNSEKYVTGFKTGANAVANYVVKDFGKPRDPYQKNYHKDINNAEEFESVDSAFGISESLLDKSRFDKRSQYWSIFVSTKNGEILKEKIFPYKSKDACLNYSDVTDIAKELMIQYSEQGDMAAAKGVLLYWQTMAKGIGAPQDEWELQSILDALAK